MKNPLSKAYTLLEVLLVIAIIGVMATFGITRFANYRERAADTRRQAELRQYQNALEIYALRNNSTYPIEATTVDASSICGSGAGQLTNTGCTDDVLAGATWPNYSYQSSAGGLDYVLWGQMELTEEFYVLCSDGSVVNMPSTWTGPSNGECPSLP